MAVIHPEAGRFKGGSSHRRGQLNATWLAGGQCPGGVAGSGREHLLGIDVNLYASVPTGGYGPRLGAATGKVISDKMDRSSMMMALADASHGARYRGEQPPAGIRPLTCEVAHEAAVTGAS